MSGSFVLLASLLLALPGRAAELMIDDFSQGQEYLWVAYGELNEVVPNVLGGNRFVSFMDFNQMAATCEHVAGPGGSMQIRDEDDYAFYMLMFAYNPRQELDSFVPEAIRFTVENMSDISEDPWVTAGTAIWNVQGQVMENVHSRVPYGGITTIDVSMDGYTGTWPEVTTVALSLFGEGVRNLRFHDVKFINSETAGTEDLPPDFALDQNFPNPFNPATRIGFSIQETQQVRLYISDARGQRVATLLDGLVSAGRHDVEFAATHLASGIYYYTLVTETGSRTRRMILLK